MSLCGCGAGTGHTRNRVEIQMEWGCYIVRVGWTGEGHGEFGTLVNLSILKLGFHRIQIE